MAKDKKPVTKALEKMLEKGEELIEAIKTKTKQNDGK